MSMQMATGLARPCGASLVVRSSACYMAFVPKLTILPTALSQNAPTLLPRASSTLQLLMHCHLPA